MPGRPGQDLIDAGQARGVLGACGATLRRIHAADPVAAGITDSRQPGQVLVHGDYGPNNVLLDPAARHVTAVVDWEWAHAGDPLEDLAWCEWIVRMHHPGHLSALRHGRDRAPQRARRRGGRHRGGGRPGRRAGLVAGGPG
jgi:hypothetical protein